MSTRSVLSAGIFGVAVAVIVVVVSCLFALLLPSSTRSAHDIPPPPEVGRSYSKEEIEEKERRAQEDLAKAREEFDRSGFIGLVWNQLTGYLPYVALAALGFTTMLGRRRTFASTAIMSAPLIILMLVARASIIFYILVLVILVVHIKFRKSVEDSPG